MALRWLIAASLGETAARLVDAFKAAGTRRAHSRIFLQMAKQALQR